MTIEPTDEPVFIAAADLKPGMKLTGPPGYPPLEVMQVEPIYPAMISVYVEKTGVVNMHSWQTVGIA